MACCLRSTKLRSSKYLNNLVEQDHRGIKSANRRDAGLQRLQDRGDYDSRHRIDASHSQGTVRTGTSGVQGRLRLQSGTRCFKLEVSYIHHGTLSPPPAIAYESPTSRGGESDVLADVLIRDLAYIVQFHPVGGEHGFKEFQIAHLLIDSK